MSYRTLLRSTFAFLATLLLSASAHAGLFRAYVSSTGNDANACTLTAPCRLLPAALAAINDGGEIWMLDSANYNTGPLNIAKSVTILAVPGALGSILAISGSAVSITASGLTISLRNLMIVPLAGGGGASGVLMTGASTLTIENSLIANLPGDGVNVSGTGKIEIANTIIRNNGLYAVHLANGASADINGTKMLNNTYGGVRAFSSSVANTTASVSDSVVSGGTAGLVAFTVVDLPVPPLTVSGGAGLVITGPVARIAVTRCTIQSTGFALVSETTGVGTSVITVSNSMIANNNFAWNQSGSGSVIRTLGNNHITDNTNPGPGALSPTALQ